MTPTGNRTTIQQIKELVENGERITARTRDLLILNAIVDIYERLGNVQRDVQPMLRFYKTGAWAATIAIAAIITLAISGKVEVIVK